MRLAKLPQVLLAVSCCLLICSTSYGPYIGHVDLNGSVLRASVFRYYRVALVETTQAVNSEHSWLFYLDFPADTVLIAESGDKRPRRTSNFLGDPIDGSCYIDLKNRKLDRAKHYYLVGISEDGSYFSAKEVTDLIRIQQDPTASLVHAYGTRLWFVHLLLWVALVLGAYRLATDVASRRAKGQDS